MSDEDAVGASHEAIRLKIDISEARRTVELERRISLSQVSITGSELRELLHHLPQRKSQPVVPEFRLSGVTVSGACNLADMQVLGVLSWKDVHFTGPLTLSRSAFWDSVDLDRVSFEDLDADDCKFVQYASLRRTRFSGPASFQRAIWKMGVEFTHIGSFGSARTLDRRSGKVEHFRVPRQVAASRFESTASFAGSRFLGPVGMRQAHFGGDANFVNCAFQDEGVFVRARFEESASFTGATFSSHANFAGVKFLGDDKDGWRLIDGSPTSFQGSRFLGSAHFSCTATGHVDFKRSLFAQDVAFTDSQFQGGAQFNQAIFRGPSGFHMTNFERGVDFANVGFHADTTFSQTRFGGESRFTGALFEGPSSFQYAHADRELRFDQAVFTSTLSMPRARWDGGISFEGSHLDVDLFDASYTKFEERLQISLSAVRVDFTGARLSSGGQLRLAGGSAISLEDADLLSPVIISGSDAAESRPMIISIQRVNAANLTLEGVSLSACLFDGALNLDKIRLGGGATFATAPMRRLRAKRNVIVEEGLAREAAGDKQWSVVVDMLPTWVDKPHAISARQVSETYRALRKSREDSKDEPGAADFYYGEMEMRRLAARRPSSEKLILSAYWFASGYALRALRAFLLLGVLLVAVGILFAAIGFPAETTTRFVRTGQYPDIEYVETTRITTDQPTLSDRLPDGLLYSLESGISLLRPSNTALTTAGVLVETVHRVLAPILLGLALLSLRGRVKR